MQLPTVEQLPTVNALLNFSATILLLLGYGLIKLDRDQLHKWTMVAAFVTSIAFLICYVTYHVIVGHKEFVGPPLAKALYLTMLASHIALAVTVPVLAIVTLYYGFRERWGPHRRIAQWTFPIWLYVSVTGVLIYLMLYVFYATPR